MLPCKLSRAQDGAVLFVLFSGQNCSVLWCKSTDKSNPRQSEKKKKKKATKCWKLPLAESAHNEAAFHSSPTHSVPKVLAEPPGT